MNGEILIPISVFAMVVIIVYLVIRKKERMALIEKGLTADILESHKRRDFASSLKWGVLAIGVGLGILVGRILVVHANMGEEEAFFSMVFLFGGTSLIIYHFLLRRMENNETPKG